MPATALYQLLLAAPLAVMMRDDCRSREIGAGWLAVFIAGVVTVSAWQYGAAGMTWNVALNTLLLVYMAAGVVLYLRVSRGRWIDPLKGHIGLGDVIFMLGLTPLTGVREYLLLLLAGMGVSLLWWGGMRIVKRRDVTVPLVGTMGAVVCVWLVYSAIR